jgi:hypothetical protein
MSTGVGEDGALNMLKKKNQCRPQFWLALGSQGRL